LANRPSAVGLPPFPDEADINPCPFHRRQDTHDFAKIVRLRYARLQDPLSRIILTGCPKTDLPREHVGKLMFIAHDPCHASRCAVPHLQHRFHSEVQRRSRWKRLERRGTTGRNPSFASAGIPVPSGITASRESGILSRHPWGHGATRLRERSPGRGKFLATSSKALSRFSSVERFGIPRFGDGLQILVCPRSEGMEGRCG